MAGERRQNKRHNTFDLLDYAAINKDGEKVAYAKGRSLNISAKGILMESAIKLPKDSHVIINLDLGEGPAEIQGKVVYINYLDDHYKLGVRFLNNSKELTTTLKNYIKTLNQ